MTSSARNAFRRRPKPKRDQRRGGGGPTGEPSACDTRSVRLRGLGWRYESAQDAVQFLVGAAELNDEPFACARSSAIWRSPCSRICRVLVRASSTVQWASWAAPRAAPRSCGGSVPARWSTALWPRCAGNPSRAESRARPARTAPARPPKPAQAGSAPPAPRSASAAAVASLISSAFTRRAVSSSARTLPRSASTAAMAAVFPTASSRRAVASSAASRSRSASTAAAAARAAARIDSAHTRQGSRPCVLHRPRHGPAIPRRPGCNSVMSSSTRRSIDRTRSLVVATVSAGPDRALT